MEYFDIHFTDLSHSPSGVGVGKIEIGDFRERFESDLSSWDARVYQRQWRTAVSQVMTADRAALVTTFAPESSADLARCWAMYREGEWIFLRERLLFLDELGQSFDANATGRYLGERHALSAEGEPISEWRTSVGALQGFLSRR